MMRGTRKIEFVFLRWADGGCKCGGDDPGRASGARLTRNPPPVARERGRSKSLAHVRFSTLGLAKHRTSDTSAH
jgi:hypothetical protein